MQALPYLDPSRYDLLQPVDPGSQRASAQQQVNENSESTGERERGRGRGGGDLEN